MAESIDVHNGVVIAEAVGELDLSAIGQFRRGSSRRPTPASKPPQSSTRSSLNLPGFTRQ